MKARAQSLLHPQQNLLVLIHGMLKQFDRVIDVLPGPVIAIKYQPLLNPDPVGGFRADTQKRAVIAAHANQQPRWNREHYAGIAFVIAEVRMANTFLRYARGKADAIAKMTPARGQVRTQSTRVHLVQGISMQRRQVIALHEIFQQALPVCFPGFIGLVSQ